MFNTALLKVNSIILDLFNWCGASLVAQLVKSPPPMWETWVQSLGCEDPLEKGKATHSSVLAWGIPGTVQSTGSQRVRNNWATFTLLMRNLPKEITILHDEKIFRISQSQAMTCLYETTSYSPVLSLTVLKWSRLPSQLFFAFKKTWFASKLYTFESIPPPRLTFPLLHTHLLHLNRNNSNITSHL